MNVNECVIPNGAEDDDEPDEFYFESDHLALKGNKDYLSLLKTLAILQAQRTRALQVPIATKLSIFFFVIILMALGFRDTFIHNPPFSPH